MAEQDDNERSGAYDYDPSKPAAIVFLAIFSVLLLIHGFQAFRLRTVWVWPLIIGLILEVVGYATRYISILNVHQIWSAIVTQVSVIVAPAFMAAMVYMCAGRMISHVGSEFSPISHNVITKVFVIADFLSILTQGGAGGLLSSDDVNTLKAGFNILIAALAFQVLILFIFIGLFIVFDRRSRGGLGTKRDPLKKLFWVFYVAAILILLRSMYRLAEFASVNFTTTGPVGYLVEHEWPLYAFDALPIAFCMIALSMIHPGSYLPLEKGLRIDGTYEEPSNRVCGCLWVSKSARRVRPESLEMSAQHPASSSRALRDGSPV